MLYKGMAVPFEMAAFEDMNKRQAEQYLTWYIDTIEQRINNLSEYVVSTGTHIAFDKSPESLIGLWDWFSKHIETGRVTEEDLKERPEWIKKHILDDGRKLSVNTVVMAYDISAYYGETVIKNNPVIKWGYRSKPKKLYGVNRPRLLGFAGDMSVYPYGTVEMCIWKNLENENNMQLFDRYNVCVSMI